jgi:spore coat protein U-like protein
MRARGIALALLFIAALPTQAATCTVTAMALSMGNVDPLRNGSSESSGTITVACIGAPGESVRYSLLLGAGGSGQFGSRRLWSAPGAGPRYNLYIDSARTQVWGDGTGGTVLMTDVLTLNGRGASRSHTVYARLAEGRDARVGTYSDSILVTLKM